MAQYNRTCQAPASLWNLDQKCGTLFSAMRKDRKTCSPTCRKRMSRASPSGQLKARRRSLKTAVEREIGAVAFHTRSLARARSSLAEIEIEIAALDGRDVAEVVPPIAAQGS